MFSAFSFGKIIKTILPGSILSGALILALEGIWQLGAHKSLIVQLAAKEWLTAVTAALVPTSLFLGFLLNTLVWLLVNKSIRAAVDAKLHETVFPEIRKKLSAHLWGEISRYLEDPDRKSKHVAHPTRGSLEYFYLPVVSLTHLNYLWESYFSWFEFQINTRYAIACSVPAGMFFLGVKMWQRNNPWFVICAFIVALVVLSAFLCKVLRRAAVENLTEYEKNLMLLIAGSLVHATSGSARRAGAGERG